MFLSQGVPMLCAGDEYGRSQGGNNNAYCQDNEISWLSWDPAKRDEKLFDFTRQLIALRRDHPIFRRPKFFQGRRIRGHTVKDVMWFNANGEEMSEGEWSDTRAHSLGMLLSGDAIDVRTFTNEPILDRTFLLLFNSYHEMVSFTMPGRESVRWEAIINTEDEDGFCATPKTYACGEEFEMAVRSGAVLRLVAAGEEEARSSSWRKSGKAPIPGTTKEVADRTSEEVGKNLDPAEEQVTEKVATR